MVNPFICGSSHLPVDEDDEIDVMLSQCSTPKRGSSRKSNSSNSNSNKNPYANRGLDKFSALLADIENKKQKIFTQVGADEISIVRFVFNSNTDDVKPIVVRLKGNNNKKENDTKKDDNTRNRDKTEQNNNNNKKQVTQTSSDDNNKKHNKNFSWRSITKMSLKWWDLKKPRYYLPLALILILVFLAIYGRTFAILCTSVGWYVIPTIKERSSIKSQNTPSSGKEMQKKSKEYARRYSEKNIVSSSANSDNDQSGSPNSVLPTTGHHAHRKSF